MLTYVTPLKSSAKQKVIVSAEVYEALYKAENNIDDNPVLAWTTSRVVLVVSRTKLDTTSKILDDVLIGSFL